MQAPSSQGFPILAHRLNGVNLDALGHECSKAPRYFIICFERHVEQLIDGSPASSSLLSAGKAKAVVGNGRTWSIWNSVPSLRIRAFSAPFPKSLKTHPSNR